MTTITHWIDGKPWEAPAARVADVFDPASGSVRGRVALAGSSEVDAAVGAAQRAFEEWSQASLGRRAATMFAFRELLDRHRDELARLVVAEHGKVHADALGEVARGLEVVELACGIPQLLKGEYSPRASSDTDVRSLRQPLGVCVGITPFNFPVMVPLWMFPIAVACGNTFVLKPSERDPSASMLLAQLLTDAGLPDGVLDVLHGDAETVDLLLAHPDVRAVSFVGSTAVARHVYETAARNGKRVQALGGAKNHMVVMPDADLDLAASAAVSAGYGSAGERCMAISVVVAVGDVADDLVQRIATRASTVRVGAGSDDGSEMGPLITAAHRDRVAGYGGRGVAEGATLVVDGRGLAVGGHDSGFWLGPCLFDHVEPSMAIYTDEIFGPVLGVVRVATLDDAMDLLAANPYANGAAIFTRDGGAARRFELDADAGMVGVNVPIPVPVAYHSFGGWKQSLFGDTHVYGTEGVRFYTRNKVVTSRWPEPSSAQHGLSFPTPGSA